MSAFTLRLVYRVRSGIVGDFVDLFSLYGAFFIILQPGKAGLEFTLDIYGGSVSS